MSAAVGSASESRSIWKRWLLRRRDGISDLTRRSGVSRPRIYKALGEDGNPSFEAIRSILGAMDCG